MTTTEKLNGIYESLGNIINDLDEIVSDEEEALCELPESGKQYRRKEQMIITLEEVSQSLSEAYEALETMRED